MESSSHETARPPPPRPQMIEYLISRTMGNQRRHTASLLAVQSLSAVRCTVCLSCTTVRAAPPVRRSVRGYSRSPGSESQASARAAWPGTFSDRRRNERTINIGATPDPPAFQRNYTGRSAAAESPRAFSLAGSSDTPRSQASERLTRCPAIYFSAGIDATASSLSVYREEENHCEYILCSWFGM